MEHIFTNVYENAHWGSNENTEYNGSSGLGSSIDYNQDTYIPFLKEFIRTHNIKSVVDLGCGDFRCGELIYGDLDVVYNGYDAYQKVIDYHSKTYDSVKYTFHTLDFCNHPDKIVSGDLCILKDVIQHWSLSNIYTFLDSLVHSNKFQYVLFINCCDQCMDNTDTIDGGFRPLNSQFLPLKKYNPIPLLYYHTKEVCLIARPSTFS